MTGIIVFQIEILYNDDENLRNNDGLSWSIHIACPDCINFSINYSMRYILLKNLA